MIIQNTAHANAKSGEKYLKCKEVPREKNAENYPARQKHKKYCAIHTDQKEFQRSEGQSRYRHRNRKMQLSPTATFP